MARYGLHSSAARPSQFMIGHPPARAMRRWLAVPRVADLLVVLVLAAWAIGEALGGLGSHPPLTIAVLAFEVKIHYEEQLMAAFFPHDYPAYRRRVTQLIPGLGRLRRQAA